jgi:hypothetical protein
MDARRLVRPELAISSSPVAIDSCAEMAAAMKTAIPVSAPATAVHAATSLQSLFYLHTHAAGDGQATVRDWVHTVRRVGVSHFTTFSTEPKKSDISLFLLRHHFLMDFKYLLDPDATGVGLSYSSCFGCISHAW